jgi:hypothetical protein
MSTKNVPMRSTLLLEVSIIRKTSHQRRMFIRRNGCPGSISSTTEFAFDHSRYDDTGNVIETREHKGDFKER